MTTKICVLHVGTHKTGTTSFQALLAQNRNYFRKHGIYYPIAGRTHPEAGRLFSHGSQRGWVHYSYGHHKLAWEVSGRRRDRWSRGNSLTQLADELRRVQPQAVLLSSEIFECLYGQPEALSRVQAMLESLDFANRVVMTLRPPADYLQSLYVELAVWHGFQGGLESFVKAVLTDGTVAFREWDFCFDYCRLASAFADVFGSTNVCTLRYDPSDSVAPLLAASVSLLGVPLPALPRGERLNTRATERHRPPGLVDQLYAMLRPDRGGQDRTPRKGASRPPQTGEVLTSSQRAALDAAFDRSFDEAIARYGS